MSRGRKRHTSLDYVFHFFNDTSYGLLHSVCSSKVAVYVLLHNSYYWILHPVFLTWSMQLTNISWDALIHYPIFAYKKWLIGYGDSFVFIFQVFMKHLNYEMEDQTTLEKVYQRSVFVIFPCIWSYYYCDHKTMKYAF